MTALIFSVNDGRHKQQTFEGFTPATGRPDQIENCVLAQVWMEGHVACWYLDGDNLQLAKDELLRMHRAFGYPVDHVTYWTNPSTEEA